MKLSEVSKYASDWIQIGAVAAPLALAAANYHVSSRRGMKIEETGRKDGRHVAREQNKRVDRAMASRRYKPVGNNVYARNRRFFADNGRVAIDQMVADNEGSKNSVYLKVGRSSLTRGGATYPHSKKRASAVVVHPGYRSNGKARLNTQYTVTHEHQHVKDFSGRNKDYAQRQRAARQALKDIPRDKSKLSDYMSGRARARYASYNDSIARYMGVFEGRADSAAAAKHRVPAHTISGYPSVGGQFEVGYLRGGGKASPSTAAEYYRDRDVYHRRAKETRR